MRVAGNCLADYLETNINGDDPLHSRAQLMCVVRRRRAAASRDTFYGRVVPIGNPLSGCSC